MALHLDRIGSFIPNYIDDSFGWAYDPGFVGYEFRDVFFDRGFDYGGGLASLDRGDFGDIYTGGLGSIELANAGLPYELPREYSSVTSDPAAVVTQPAGTGTVDTTADVFTRAPTEIPTDLSGAQALILANELGLGTGDVARGVSDAQVTQAAQDALTGNLTKADISVLSQAGLGPETGFNIHNPTQSVAQMQAAQNAGDFASQYLVPFLISSIPGAGLAMTGANLAQGLSSGQITGAQALSRVAPIALQAMFPGSAEAAIVGGGISGLLQGQTPGQVAVNAGINIISQQTGLPPGTIAAIANGDFGSVAASTVMGALRTEIAQQTGLPSAVINAGLDITGAGRTLSSAISGGINDALGSSNQNNLGALSSFINASLSGTGTAQTGTAGSGTMVGGALPVGGFLPNLGGTVSSGLDRVSGSSDTTGATTGAPTAATTTTTATTPTRKKRQPVVSTTDFTGGATGSEEGDLAASAGYGGDDQGYFDEEQEVTGLPSWAIDPYADTTTDFTDPRLAFVDTEPFPGAFTQDEFGPGVQVATSQPGLQPYYLQGAVYHLPDYELLQKRATEDLASQALISDLAGQAQQNVYAEQTANELLQQLGGSAIQDLAQSTQGTVYDVAGDPYADLGETATETTQQTDQGQVDLDKILESLLPTDQALAPDSGDIDALLNEIVGGAQQPTGTEVTERERTAFEEANMLPEGGTLETTLPDTQTEAQPVTQPTEDVVTTTPVEAPAPGAGQTTEVVTETPTNNVVVAETPSGGPVTTETPTGLPTDVTGGVTETSTEETTEDTTVTQPSTTGEATTLPAQGVVQDLIDAGLTQEGGGVTLEDVVSTPTTPTTPTDTTETATPTTPTGPAGDAVVTQTPTSSEQLTAQDVTSIVNQAIAANPSLSAQDVQNAINAAISNLPAGITAADVNTAINSALSNLPASVTPEQMQSAIASATKEIQGSQLTSSDVSTIVNNAISANPGLSVTDVQSVVNNAISNIPAGLTAADVNTAISEALNNLPAFVTPEQMQGAVSAAIQQIQGSQLTSSDVSNIVSDALAANPGLNIQDVENVVNTAVSNIPAGLTATDVNTAISNALNNLPASVTPEQMQGAVNAAIQEIQKSQVTTQDVSNIVNQAIAANPGLSTQDVERVVNNAISNIPAGLTKDDVNAAINSALGGLPDSVTPEEMQGAVNNAIQEIQKSQITTQDVSNIVNEAISSNPGLSTEDVERVVNTALSNLPAGLTASDVNTAISNALSALPDFVTPDQMQGAVNIAIEEIKEGQLTANQVNSIVNAALTSNPGLKIEDVQEVVSNAIDNLPAGITAADVNTAVTTAISNLPASVTPAQLTAAVNNAVSTAVSTAVQTSQAQSTNQMQQLMAMLGSRGGQRQAAQPTVYTPVLANFKDTFDVDDLFMGGNDRTTVEDLLSIIGAGRRS